MASFSVNPVITFFTHSQKRSPMGLADKTNEERESESDEEGGREEEREEEREGEESERVKSRESESV